MEPEVLVAVLALVVSVITFVWTLRSHSIQAKHATLQANMAVLVEVWGALAKNPSLLRFHGISPAELQEVGVDAEELAYLVASFEAASVYYRYFENTPNPFPEGSLRQRMCASEATQRAWPLLQRFFAGDTNYLSKIQATIDRSKSLPLPNEEP
ncbi:MAG TPA: hypothetical protein VGC13_17280 [Longimicrobium sp.]|jgi:hypothetical protein|uniref:hypothetical protein n=1 Tax=Longimicrobium sp. TaxID=2029185 RepID=UPI002ED8E34B